MGKFVVFAIAAIGMASILVGQHFSNESLRQDNDALRQRLAAFQELSDVTTPAAVDDAGLNDDQHAELLRLRAEATQLQSQTNQITVLTEANQKLRDSLRAARTSGEASASKKKGPEDALPQDIHPKDSWAYRGYSTPDATIESTLWAMMHGDKDTALRAFSPEMLPEMEKQLEGKDFAEEMKKMNMAEFRVLDRQQISPDEMVLSVYTARQDENGNNVNNSQEDTVFRRVNGEWKVTKDKPPSDN